MDVSDLVAAQLGLDITLWRRNGDEKVPIQSWTEEITVPEPTPRPIFSSMGPNGHRFSEMFGGKEFIQSLPWAKMKMLGVGSDSNY